MPSVLQINVSANWGSHGKICSQIGDIILDNGWDSYIAYGVNMSPSRSQLIKIGGRYNFYKHALMTRLFDRHGLSSIRETRHLVQTIREIDPDIIHLHNLHGYYVNYKILFQCLSECQKPVVWTLHDCWPFTGHCAHFERFKCFKWRTGCHDCVMKRRYPQSLFFDNSEKAYRLKKSLFNGVHNLTLVPVSKWLERYVRESFLSHHNIKVIYNGVDLDVFKPYYTYTSDSALHLQDLCRRSGKKIVLGVASIWAEHRGMKDFIMLSEHEDLQIILIGVKEEQRKKIPQNIFCINRTTDQGELAQFYSLADVYVNPTHMDNFPTTNIEALACGTPVVTYNTGGAPEAISMETGRVVEKSDVQGLYKAICELTNNGKPTAACRERALACFSKNDRYEDYFEIYKTLL